jgi:hypothetical protein
MLRFHHHRRLTVTVLGFAAAIAMLQTANAPAAEDKPQPRQLENQFFSVNFDTASGRLHAWRKDGTPFLSRSVSRIITAVGERRTSDPEYTRTVTTTRIKNELGGGQQLTARCKDGKGQVDFKVRVTLYDGRDALVVEAICQNASAAEPLEVRNIEPVRAVFEEGGACQWPGLSKVLTNGKHYFDAGRVEDFGVGASQGSWWNICFYRGEREPGLVVGYVDSGSAMSQIMARYDRFEGLPGRPECIALVADSAYEREFVLRPGTSVTSDQLMFNIAPDPFTALESYAQAVGDARQARLNPIVNGWCSWFSFYGYITEDEVVRQAEFAARELKPYGFEYVQVDDGFYRTFGDWEGNDRFPHGMKWLANRIRQAGLKPGIWLAPYVIAEGSEIHQKHPDWLVHRPNGKLQQVGPWYVEGSEEAMRANPKFYALDITHPDAAQWLGKLFETVANEWGYDFIKIDFVDWSLLAAERYYDPTVTLAGAYRKGFEIMRQAIGPKRHLLDCGPGQVTVGLLDSMRIELDQPPVTWQQYFLHPASSSPAAAKRYYFHNRTWINDDDHVCLNLLTIPQAQAAATVVSLSGGTMMSGDRMSDLDPGRLQILKKVFPSYGQAARPVDLFERDKPEIFALPVKKSFDNWLVVGLFNPDEKSPAEKSVAIHRLGLDPSKTYVAYDFWNQRFFGEIRGNLWARLEPASVLVLAIHEKLGVPQVISTDRHLSQGGIELENVQWDAASSTLKGVSLGPPGSEHRVYVYLPDRHPWVQTHPFFFYDFPGYTLKIMEPNILRVHLRFDKSGRVAWEVNTKKLFGQ